MSLKRVVGLAAVFAAACAPGIAVAKTAAPTIRTLSNRADLISAGDALTQVTPAGARVTLNGVNVTSKFAVRPDGRYLALLDGLRLGDNAVKGSAHGRVAKLIITNHPQGGPVTAGPQIKPWGCFTGALDAQCNRPVSYSWSYMPSGGSSLMSYDPSKPATDVAMTTTDQGKVVPFIVRQETGTIDRDQYRIAALYDPTQPYAPYAPQAGNNHKLVITHGASCDTGYSQADSPDVTNAAVLSKGFIVMSNALDNAGHNCSVTVQAEALMMTKEHVIDTYGTVRYAIGSGCSGGSLTQQQVANAYPGIYQGITPQCSFTDAWSSANQYVDYQLLLRYFGGESIGTLWTPDKQAEAEGHLAFLNAITFTTVIPSSGDPSRACPGVAAKDVFDEKTDPKGVRCSLQDYMVNVFGRRPSDGYAKRPYDNVGVQYGLKPLLAGQITPADFVDLNAKIGGWDINYNHTAARSAADPQAVNRAYRSGAINQADNLNKVAIIDLRGPDPGAFHDVYRTYTMRARLMRDFGTAANQILWQGAVPLLGDINYANQAIFAEDAWLGAVEKDKRPGVPLSEKLLQDKPTSLTNRCTDGAGFAMPASFCKGLVVAYSDPRQVAGEPPVDDIEKCQLKPLARSDYEGVSFTDAQWTSLHNSFPSGVCDFTKPGVDRVPTSVWQTYQSKNGSVIYGGKPLGAAPRSHVIPRDAVRGFGQSQPVPSPSRSRP